MRSERQKRRRGRGARNKIQLTGLSGDDRSRGTSDEVRDERENEKLRS